MHQRPSSPAPPPGRPAPLQRDASASQTIQGSSYPPSTRPPTAGAAPTAPPMSNRPAPSSTAAPPASGGHLYSGNGSAAFGGQPLQHQSSASSHGGIVRASPKVPPSRPPSRPPQAQQSPANGEGFTFTSSGASFASLPPSVTPIRAVPVTPPNTPQLPPPPPQRQRSPGSSTSAAAPFAMRTDTAEPARRDPTAASAADATHIYAANGGGAPTAANSGSDAYAYAAAARRDERRERSIGSPSAAVGSSSSFDFSVSLCGNDTLYIADRMAREQQRGASSPSASTSFRWPTADGSPQSPSHSEAYSGAKKPTTLSAEISRQLQLALAARLRAFSVAAIAGAVTENANGFMTIDGTVSLATDSRGIKREAIVVVGAFFSEPAPILSVIAAALKATKPSAADGGPHSPQSPTSPSSFPSSHAATAGGAKWGNAKASLSSGVSPIELSASRSAGGPGGSVRLGSLFLSRAYVNDVLVVPASAAAVAAATSDARHRGGTGAVAPDRPSNTSPYTSSAVYSNADVSSPAPRGASTSRAPRAGSPAPTMPLPSCGPTNASPIPKHTSAVGGVRLMAPSRDEIVYGERVFGN